MSVQYAIKDRDGKITQEPGKKAARRDQKAFGGMIVRAKGEGDFKPWKPKKVFLYVFLGIQAIFIIWLITGMKSDNTAVTATSAQVVNYCKGNGWQALYSSYADCAKNYAATLTAAGDVGKGMGASLVVIIWVVVDFLVGLTYGIYRLVKR